MKALKKQHRWMRFRKSRLIEIHLTASPNIAYIVTYESLESYAIWLNLMKVIDSFPKNSCFISKAVKIVEKLVFSWKFIMSSFSYYTRNEKNLLVQILWRCSVLPSEIIAEDGSLSIFEWMSTECVPLSQYEHSSISYFCSVLHSSWIDLSRIENLSVGYMFPVGSYFILLHNISNCKLKKTYKIRCFIQNYIGPTCSIILFIHCKNKLAQNLFAI